MDGLVTRLFMLLLQGLGIMIDNDVRTTTMCDVNEVLTRELYMLLHMVEMFVN